LDKKPIFEDKLSGNWIGDVCSQVLLNVCVFVVIDPDETMTCPLCQEFDGACFPARRGSFDQDWEHPGGDDPREINKLSFYRWCHDVVIGWEFSPVAFFEIKGAKFDIVSYGT
jgi:hypothetical protein